VSEHRLQARRMHSLPKNLLLTMRKQMEAHEYTMSLGVQALQDPESPSHYAQSAEQVIPKVLLLQLRLQGDHLPRPDRRPREGL
jgi:hypothetical protein